METKNKLKSIPVSNTYEGYLWWSDRQSPEVYQNQILPGWPSETANPFIVEGQLWDQERQQSYSIRFVDGEYFVNSFNLKDLKEREYIPKEYLPNRFPKEIRKLCFREYWYSEPDEFCEGMEVLKPSMIVFTGFNDQEE